MRIVAAGAVRLFEWLIVMRLLQGSVFYIVTIDAQRRSCLGQMKVEFWLAGLARLMCDVAGIAAHV